MHPWSVVPSRAAIKAAAGASVLLILKKTVALVVRGPIVLSSLFRRFPLGVRLQPRAERLHCFMVVKKGSLGGTCRRFSLSDFHAKRVIRECVVNFLSPWPRNCHPQALAGIQIS
jgi:hypothetical protein